MKILSWNIQSGGGRRLHLIIERILTLEPDIFIATEFRANKSAAALNNALRVLYPYHAHAASEFSNINSVAIYSKENFTRLPCRCAKEDRHRFISINLNGVKIIGAYFAQGMAKQSQFNYLIKDAQRNGTKNKIIIGDLNTGNSDMDSEYSSFYCEDDFRILATKLFSDAYRYKNKQKRVYSWWSNNGYGYRIDHCLCDASLSKKIKKCYYIEKWKDAGASDHAPLFVEL